MSAKAKARKYACRVAPSDLDKFGSYSADRYRQRLVAERAYLAGYRAAKREAK